MQTIDITDFWINRPSTSNSNNFTILSDKWCSLNNCTIGNGKAYYYNGLVDKQQLKCIVIDDTFYFDFSATPITDVIKQQMWILKHTKNIDYKIEFVCLWEMFKLPTIEQLNEFAKIKQEVVVPQVTSQSEYDNAVEEMRLSTGLSERNQLNNIRLPLSEYTDLMRSMYHTRLSNEGAVNYATIIHNYHNPVVQSISLEQALQELHNGTTIEEPDFRPGAEEGLNEYIDSIINLSNGTLTYEQLQEYSTIVYNNLINIERQFVDVEDLVEVIDHRF